jgi:hypothetical protein
MKCCLIDEKSIPPHRMYDQNLFNWEPYKCNEPVSSVCLGICERHRRLLDIEKVNLNDHFWSFVMHMNQENEAIVKSMSGTPPFLHELISFMFSPIGVSYIHESYFTVLAPFLTMLDMAQPYPLTTQMIRTFRESKYQHVLSLISQCSEEILSVTTKQPVLQWFFLQRLRVQVDAILELKTMLPRFAEGWADLWSLPVLLAGANSPVSKFWELLFSQVWEHASQEIDGGTDYSIIAADLEWKQAVPVQTPVIHGLSDDLMDNSDAPLSREESREETWYPDSMHTSKAYGKKKVLKSKK